VEGRSVDVRLEARAGGEHDDAPHGRLVPQRRLDAVGAQRQARRVAASVV
jgi:hypothetical protein